jgi:hypothetical protein
MTRISWIGNGECQLQYTTTRAGEYTVRAWCHCEAGFGLDPTAEPCEVPGSLQRLNVMPATLDVSRSCIFDGLEETGKRVFVATTEFRIYAYFSDRFGNDCPPTQEAPGGTNGELRVALVGPGPDQVRELQPKSCTEVSLEDDGDESCHRKKYMVADSFHMIGEYRLMATLAGEHLRGSPIEFEVRAGVADAGHSSLVLPEEPAWANVPWVCVVQPHDQWGNPVRHHHLGSVVSARVDGPSRAICTVHRLEDGSTRIEVGASMSGDYRLQISLNGVSLAESPVLVRVYPNPVRSDLKDLCLSSHMRRGASTVHGGIAGFADIEFQPWSLARSPSDRSLLSSQMPCGASASQGSMVSEIEPQSSSTLSRSQSDRSLLLNSSHVLRSFSPKRAGSASPIGRSSEQTTASSPSSHRESRHTLNRPSSEHSLRGRSQNYAQSDPRISVRSSDSQSRRRVQAVDVPSSEAPQYGSCRSGGLGINAGAGGARGSAPPPVARSRGGFAGGPKWRR